MAIHRLYDYLASETDYMLWGDDTDNSSNLGSISSDDSDWEFLGLPLSRNAGHLSSGSSMSSDGYQT